jgi:hypothetical protein
MRQTWPYVSSQEPNLRFREIELQSLFWRARKLGTSIARFRRVNEGCRTMHHDALELPGGKIVLLTVSAGRLIRNCNSVTSDQPLSLRENVAVYSSSSFFLSAKAAMKGS